MSDALKKQKLEEIAKLLSAARQALTDAQAIADEHALSFKWSDDYGSEKQTYCGKGTEIEEYDWEKNRDVKRILTEGEWDSSSKHCD